MMLSKTTASAAACRGLRNSLPARLPAAAGAQRNVAMRFRKEKKSEVERLEQQLSKDSQTPTDAANKFSAEQIEQVNCAGQLQQQSSSGDTPCTAEQCCCCHARQVKSETCILHAQCI
jgi:hypothetical protein